MSDLLREIRYSARRLTRTPGFTLIVVLTLALGAGANTAIFSVVDGVLLRALPYRDPERLVTVEHFYPTLNNLRAPVSVPGFRDYSARTQDFTSAAVEAFWTPNLTGHGDPERLTGTQVTAGYFRTLGATASRGRTLAADEDQPGKSKVAILGDGLAQRLFGAADPVGQTLTLNGEPYEIVGVMPASFRDFFNKDAELWSALQFRPEQYADNQRTSEFLSFIGRMPERATLDGVRRDMAAYASQLKHDFPNSYESHWTLTVTPLQEKAVGGVRSALLVLLGAVGFVLVIACANVANLQLARAASHFKEVAIRSALGAGRRRIVRQLMIESVLLALAGGASGLGLAALGVHLVHVYNPSSVPRVQDIRIDGSVLLFTLATAIVTGVLFGLAPVVQTLKANLQDTLREGGRTNAADRGGNRLRRALVIAEFGLALTLLAGAGLLMRSFARVEDVDPGFNPRHVLTFTLALPATRYGTDTAERAFFDQVLPKLAAMPGVESVGSTSTLPFGGQWSTGSFTVEGYTPAPNQPAPWGDIRVISPDFFASLRVPKHTGRFFTAQDGPGSPKVVIVDDEFVKRFWPNADPIGKRITFDSPRDSVMHWMQVVGVVAHTKHEGLDAENRIQLYLALDQFPTRNQSVTMRTAGSPMNMVASVRDVVHGIDHDLPISKIAPMEQLIDQSVGQRRFSMLLLALFAGIALLLASIGIYGVMSYSVAQRSHEIGVRMALGAKRGRVLRLVMQQGLTTAVAGVGIGLAGAFALTRVLRTQLFGVSATDPGTFIVVTLVLTTIAAAATLVPALRATKLDPVTALRDG